MLTSAGEGVHHRTPVRMVEARGAFNGDEGVHHRLEETYLRTDGGGKLAPSTDSLLRHHGYGGLLRDCATVPMAPPISSSIGSTKSEEARCAAKDMPAQSASPQCVSLHLVASSL